jgi:hypothetical protein
MREVTFEELDAEFAEQLPARELMFLNFNHSFNVTQIADASGTNVGSGNVHVSHAGVGLVVTDTNSGNGGIAINHN